MGQINIPKKVSLAYDPSTDSFKPIPFNGKPLAFYSDSTPKGKEEEVSPKIIVAQLCFSCKHPVCEACGECEEEGCKLIGKCITSKKDMINAGLSFPKTQKAMGFIQLMRLFGLTIPQPYTIITESDDIQYTSAYDAFIRPCPVRPRHGFVESRRMISTKDNIRKVWEECRQADPEGELIICSAINATYNAIITPSMLAVGPGNAGATGGKDSVSLPLMGVLPAKISNVSKLLEAGVDINTHDPYLELVYNKPSTSWVYTQLRAGAKVPKAPDYVPERIRVDKVLEASGDLMEWEKQIATITKGCVVYHLGGTLISHYGVHCLTNGIPILTTRVPNIGEILEPIGEVVVHEPAQIIKGLALGAVIPLYSEIGLQSGFFSIRDMLPIMMTVLHNSPAMGNGWGMWVGFAASIMMRAGMAASHGEARHATYDNQIVKSFSRSTIYTTSLKDFFGSRETLGHAQWAFRFCKWSEGSYGGKKWASCTESVLLLDQAIRNLMQKPVEANRVSVINALNRAVNEAHNGGWWLNKFVTQDVFTDASNQALKALERVATHLIPVNNYFDTIPMEQWKAVAFKWANAGDIKIISKYGQGARSSITINSPEEKDEEEDIIESHPYLENYNTTFGYDPNCCADCWDNYHQKLASKSALSTNKPVPGPSKDISKCSINTKAVEKAHVRFVLTGGGFTAHIQAKLAESNKYWSYDSIISKDISSIMLDRLGKVPKSGEDSYSSDAGGYLPMSIKDIGVVQVFTEPISGAVFFLNSTGDIDVGIEKGATNGQTENKESQTIETKLVS